MAVVLQTRNGYLWLGTQEGLVRFDGVAFTLFNKANTPVFTTSSPWPRDRTARDLSIAARSVLKIAASRLVGPGDGPPPFQAPPGFGPGFRGFA